MKKLIAIVFVFLSMEATAQFSPILLQTIDTPYLSMNRIGTTNYTAALRKEGLDIREAGTTDFGLPQQFVSIPDLDLASSMEVVGNYAYVMNYSLTSVNLSNPLLPAVTASSLLPARSSTHTHWGNFLYNSTGSKCYIYSLSNPASPALIDSIDFPVKQMKSSGNNIYTCTPDRNRIYHWIATNTAPYLFLNDSLSVFTLSSIASIDVSGTQLLLKNGTDSLYRFRITSNGMLAPLSTEQLPGYANNGSLVARDTSILGYARYNTFYLSQGTAGNSFADSSQVMTDGNYTIYAGRLDNNLFYTNVRHTYLIAFAQTTGIETQPGQVAFNAYPVPAGNLLTVSLNSPKNFCVKIVDMLGRVLLQQTVKGNKNQINLSALQAGDYLLFVFDGQQRVGIKKITKI